MGVRRVLGAVVLALFAWAFTARATAAEPVLRSLGEIEVALYGLSAGVDPASPIVPKQTAGGVRVVVHAAGRSLSSSEVARLLGGPFQVRAELSGPGLPVPLSLPVTGSGAVPSPDPLVLAFPGLPYAGDYELANIRLVRDGRAVLDVLPRRVTVRVIEQILVTSVVTRPLTLAEIRERGVVLDSSSYLGFEFAITLRLDSTPVVMRFPVVFDREGVSIPVPLAPPDEPLRSLVTAPELVPVLLRPVAPEDEPDGAVLMTMGGDGGDDLGAGGGIPSLLVIPGSMGYLKQFFSALLLVGNGAPVGSGLVVRDVTGTLAMPPGDDGERGTADDPLALPVLESGPQSPTLVLLGANGSTSLAPGEFAQGELTLRGELEGRHDVDFEIRAQLDGLPIGPVPLSGRAHGAVLVRNAYFDVTFGVPTVVRADEEFSVHATVTNIGQGVGQDVNVTMDPARLSGARLLSAGTQTIDVLPAGDSRTVEYRFRSEVTGEVVASYLRFDTNGGVDVTGRLNFRIGVGERGVVMSPDTLILPDSVQALPPDVVRAAMRVLGQAWSAARAPTLPPDVERPGTEAVYRKGLLVAEAGLRVQLGQPLPTALRDLLLDFHGAGFDPGFDQVLRETSAGTGFDRAVALAIEDAVGSDVLAYHEVAAEVAASGEPFLSFAVENAGSGALPGGVALIDGAGRRTDVNVSGVATAFEIPIGSPAEGQRIGWLSSLATPPYVLQIDGDMAGAVNLSVVVPGSDGQARYVRLHGVAVSLGSRARLIYDPANGGDLDLHVDSTGDGVYEQSSRVVTAVLASRGPQLVSAATIGRETLAGTSGLGTRAALLFDRVVSATDAADTSHYEIPQNAVIGAQRQLSGRLVFVALEQPEGPLVPTSLSVQGIRDERGAGGFWQELALGSRLTGTGAVVTGRVLHADGSAVPDALVTYANSSGTVTASGCEATMPIGVAAQRTDAAGRYTFRYVRQDDCGAPFRIETQDPTTGAVRGVKAYVRANGQSLALDIVLIGHGTVSGTVRHADQSVAANARVRVVSVTDSQIGFVTMTDSQGVYTVERMTVGAVTATAVLGANLGRSAGRLDVAGGTTTVNITLDGDVDIRGSVRKLENGVLTVLPGVDVVYYRDGLPLGLSVTDEQGQYRLLGVPAGPYSIKAGLNQRDKTSLEGNSIAGQKLVQNLVIEVLDYASYGTVRGAVRLQSGSPVADAWVSDGVVAARADDLGQYELAAVALSASPRTITGVSPDGRRSGTTSVLLTSQGQVEENADIALSGLGTAVFQVVDDQGAGVAGASVGLKGSCLNPCGCRFATSDSQGLARFDNLAFGPVTARAVVAQPRWDSAEGTAIVASEETPAGGLIPLGGFGTVAGSVSNPDGTPAHGAVVQMTALTFLNGVSNGARVCGLAREPRTATTNSEGRFEFADVHVGSVAVETWSDFHPKRVQASGQVAIAGGHQEFTLQLAESPDTMAGVLSGTVWLPDKSAGAGPDVEVTASGRLGDVTVRTDAQGYFSFARVLPAGSYLLTARDARPDGTGSVAQTRVALQAAQPASHELWLKVRGPVRVTVVDGSGVPVEDAAVTVWLKESEFPYREYQGTIDGPGTQPVVFPAVFEGDFAVNASDVFARGGRSGGAVPPDGQPVEVKVQLTTTATVVGRFLWPDRVTPLPFGTVRLIAGGRVIGQQTTAGEGDVGTFAFDYVPAGGIRLEAEDPRSGRTGTAAGTLASQGEILVLDVVAYAVGRVEGDVTLNGAPAPSAGVALRSGRYKVQITADGEGHYVVEGVPEGTVVATADLGLGFLAGTAQGTLSGEGATLDLPVALHDAGTIEGKLLAANGVDPGGVALVTLSVGGRKQTTTSDEQGDFRFDLVPEGTIQLAVEALQSIDCVRQDVTVAGGQTATPTLTLLGVGAVAGTVTGPAGPVAGRVKVLGTGPGCQLQSWHLTVGPNGQFRIPELIAGAVSAAFETSAPGQARLTAVASDLVRPGQTTTLDLALEPNGSVEGTVVHEDGSPAVGSRLRITASAGRFANVTTTFGGSFSAQGLPVGPITIRVDDTWRAGVALVTGLSVTEDETLLAGEIRLVETPLTVTAVTPADAAVDVAVTEPIQLQFSAPMASPAVYLKAPDHHVGFAGSLSTDRRMYTMTGTWPDSTEILIDAGTYWPGTYDIYGRRLANVFHSRFRTLDLSPPRVVSVTPANGAIQVDPSATVAVQFDEAIEVEGDLDALVRVASPEGAVSGQVTSTGPDSLLFTPAAPLPSNLAYTVTVNGVTDLLGHVQTSAHTSSFATPDSVAPALRLSAPPLGGWTKQRRPTIRVAVTDALSAPDVSNAELSVDGQPVSVARTGSTFSHVPQVDLADGTHTVSAAAYDRGGNRGELTASFQIDSQPPSPAVVTAPIGDQVLSGVVTLSGQASDDASGVVRLDLFSDGYRVADAPAVDGLSTTWNSVGASEGSHTIAARATDVAGNAGPMSAPVRVIINNKALSVAITAPPEAARFKTTVTVAAQPSEPVARVEFRAGSGTVVVDDTAPYEATLDLLAEPEGDVILAATAFGLAPETATATRTITVDRTPPPAPDFTKVHAEATGESTLVVGLKDAVELGALVKIVNPSRSAANQRASSSDGSFAMRVPGAAGETLGVTATDEAGNESDPLAVTIEEAPAAEASIPLEGLALWARSGEGVTADPEGRVSRWADQSGQGNDLIQDTLLKQPLLAADPVSGRAVLRFDGSGDWMTFTTRLDGTIRAVFAVLKSVGESSQYLLGDVSAHDFYPGASTLWRAPSYAGGSASPAILNGETWLNGVPVDGAETARPATMSVLSVLSTAGVTADRLFMSGNGSYPYSWKGDIAELIIYAEPLTASQRKSVEDYLALKYAAFVGMAGAPDFSPNGGTFEESVEVSLGSPTPAADVYYTTDGSEPTETSTLYSGPFVLTQTTTLRARAYRAGMNTSPVALVSFTKSSDFTPGSIGGLALWARSDAGVQADSGHVSVWTDQSGQGNHLTQTTVAQRPLLVPGEPEVLNGRAVLRFDGSGDWMTFTTRLDGTIRAVFAVLKSVGESYQYLLGDVSARDFYPGASTLWRAPSYAGGSASPAILNGETWLNGVPVDGTETARPATMSVLSVLSTAGVTADRLFMSGNGSYPYSWKGDIAELIIYTEPLTASQRKSVEDYLALKYAAYVGTAGAPEFSPNGGMFEESVEVSLSSPTPAANVYYTTDGSEPTETSTPYSGPFVLTQTTTLRARAYRAGMNTSPVALVSFTKSSDFTPGSIGGLALWTKSDVGVQADSGLVAVWADQSGQGNDLTQTTVAQRPLLVPGEPEVLNGRAVLRFDGSGDWMTFTTRLDGTIRAVFAVLKSVGESYQYLLGDVSARDFYPGASTLWRAPSYAGGSASPAILNGETWLNGVPVDGTETARPATMSVLSVLSTAGVTADRLFMSGNGSYPYSWKGDIAELIIYTEPLTASQRKSVEDYLALKYAAYVGTAGAPEFSPNGGMFEESVEVSLSSPTPAADVYYTTDGSEPTETSTLYSGPFVLTQTTTLRARAYRAGMNTSPVALVSFTKSSDFTPGSIGGLALWTKSDTDLQADSAGRVSVWRDQSGQGNDLTQTTVTRRPVLVPEQSNGLPVLRFDGSGDGMTFTTRLEGTIRAVFATLKDSGGTGNRFFLGDTDTNHFYPGTSTLWGAYASASIRNGETWLNGVLIDGTTTVRPTAMSVLSVVPTSGVTADRLFAGNENYASSWLGDIAELIIYTEPITASQRKSVEDYLTLKYAAYVGTAARPEFSPNGEMFEESVEVSLGCPTPGADVYYTTDGSEPTETSTLYSGPLLLTETTLLQARAYHPRMNPGAVAVANFTKTTDFSPAAVAGLALWARADVGVEADSGQVSVWRDVSGRHNDLTQATLAAPPQLVPDDGNGRQVVRFDGVDDVLLFTRPLANIRTVFWVVREDAETAEGVRCLLGDQSTYNFLGGSKHQIWSGSAALAIRDGETRVNSIPKTGTTENRPTELSVVSLLTTGDVTASRFSRDRNDVDSSWKGDLAELIVYDRTLTDAERKDVEDYLALKHQLFTPTAAAPTFTPHGSVSAAPVQVTITAEPGSAVYYTTDGSEPSPPSSPYVEPLLLTSRTTLKARAYRAGFNPSPVTTAVFLDGETPAPLRSPGLRLWVKADAGVSESGGYVSRWEDQSGSGNHLVQATASAQPQLLPGEVNGLPVVRLDGAGDFMSFTTRLTAIRTVFWVARRSPAMTEGYRFLLGDYQKKDFYSGSGTQIWSSSYANALVLNGETRLNGALADGTTAERPSDLTLISLVTTGEVFADAFSRDRTNGRSWYGDLAELLIYDRALSDSEREAIEGHLAEKYVLYTPTVTVPTITPPGGAITGSQLVHMDTRTPGAAIYYTLDDGPTQEYAGPIEIAGTTRIRAWALRAGWNDSSEIAVTFLGQEAFTPASLPGLTVWVRADAGVADSPAGSWEGQDPTGNDLLQATDAMRPRLVLDAESGMPLLQFDGKDDWLRFSSRSLTNIRTVFWVIRRSASMTTGYSFLLGDVNRYHFHSGSSMQIWSTSTNVAIRNGETRLNGAIITGTATDRPLDLSVISLVTTGDVVADAFSRDRIYGRSWWGDLGELVIYDRALTPEERLSVEEYLAGRYGIGLAQ